MEQRRLGSTGLYVSRLALGTMTWGRDTDADDAAAQLKAFIEAGGTLIDTSDTYVDGESERIIGRLLTDVARRQDLVIATTAGRIRDSDGQRGRDASRRHLLDALDASLERLGTDHVDLWQVHTWDPLAPLEETLAALDTAVSSGRTRYVGISNYCGWQTAQAATWQRAWPGRAPIASNQVEYSLLQRGIEREVLPAALSLGIGILPWSPLGRGVLTGKYRGGTPADSRGGSPELSGFVQRYLDERSAGIVNAVMTAADGMNTSPLAIALAWVRDRPGVVAPVVGARTAGQLKASLDAESLRLPDSLLVALDDISAPPTGYPEQPRPS